MKELTLTLGSLDDLIDQMKDKSLADQLKPHADAMMRKIFDHCLKHQNQTQKKSNPIRGFPSSKTNIIPSLADPAILKTKPDARLF